MKRKKINSKALRSRRLWGFFIFLTAILLLWAFGYSLQKGEPLVVYKQSSSKLKLSLKNFSPIAGANYELWQITPNQEISLGKFNLNAEGQLIDAYGQTILGAFFDLSTSSEETKSFKITIEPQLDDSLEASPIEMVSGKKAKPLEKTSAKLEFILDFSQISGNYFLISPTDGNTNSNENAGIWFFQEVNKMPIPSLNLPILPEGWKYESWIVYENETFSLGKFTDPGVNDEANKFSGPKSAPAFPGEDFLRKSEPNFTQKLPFKLNNGSTQIFLTLEPDQQGTDPTGDRPFFLQFLNATINKDAPVHTVLPLTLDLGKIPSAKIQIQ